MATYLGYGATLIVLPDVGSQVERRSYKLDNTKTVLTPITGYADEESYSYILQGHELQITGKLRSDDSPGIELPQLAKELATAIHNNDLAAVSALVDWVYENLVEMKAKEALSRESLVQKMLQKEYEKGFRDGEGYCIEDSEPYEEEESADFDDNDPNDYGKYETELD